MRYKLKNIELICYPKSCHVMNLLIKIKLFTNRKEVFTFNLKKKHVYFLKGKFMQRVGDPLGILPFWHFFFYFLKFKLIFFWNLKKQFWKLKIWVFETLFKEWIRKTSDFFKVNPSSRHVISLFSIFKLRNFVYKVICRKNCLEAVFLDRSSPILDVLAVLTPPLPL